MTTLAALRQAAFPASVSADSIASARMIARASGGLMSLSRAPRTPGLRSRRLPDLLARRYPIPPRRSSSCFFFFFLSVLPNLIPFFLPLFLPFLPSFLRSPTSLPGLVPNLVHMLWVRGWEPNQATHPGGAWVRRGNGVRRPFRGEFHAWESSRRPNGQQIHPRSLPAWREARSALPTSLLPAGGGPACQADAVRDPLRGLTCRPGGGTSAGASAHVTARTTSSSGFPGSMDQYAKSSARRWLAWRVHQTRAESVTKGRTHGAKTASLSHCV